MPITLNEIPGFADIADSNFAAEAYAIGLNFQRIADNAKFGIVRPEVFVGRYVNGDTVPLPTSGVDGYTYTREELTYAYSFGLTGGTSTTSNGQPSVAGAIRYITAFLDQLTGMVSTNVEYLVGDGSAPQVTTDGTLTVFTFGTRRLTSLVVSTPPAYVAVADGECIEDAAVTDTIMQRWNRNSKFAALSAEIMYMGEFTDGTTVARPTSPADGYEYAYDEVILMGFWRWTTQGTSLTDPPDPNHKQINDIYWSIDPTTGAVAVEVDYYHNTNYNSNDGRLMVMAFCKRTITSFGSDPAVFTDLSLDFLASGRPDRYDVMQVAMRLTRFAILRTEFFQHGVVDYTLGVGGVASGSLPNGSYVPLPVSSVDGYAYSRDELSYVFSYTGTGPNSTPRMYDWNCDVDQGTGLVTSQITRVPNGGASVPTTDGHLAVVVIARRGHVSAFGAQYNYTGGGNGVNDFSALQNGGFDNWNKNSDPIAQAWALLTVTGTGSATQAAGLVSGFSQRLATAASGDVMAIMSSSISVATGDLRFFSFVTKPSGTGSLTATIYFYSPVGDVAHVVLTTVTPPSGIVQNTGWLKIPAKDDTVMASSWGNLTIVGTLDFIPATARIVFSYTDTAASHIDLDEVTFISQLNPSIGQVASRGSNSLAFFPALAFTATDTTFTPDLDFTITRVDGTVTTVAGGSPVTTGLTAGTTYDWYPFYNEITQQTDAITASGVGTPPTLQTATSLALSAAWYGIGHLPYAAAPLAVITTASGAPPSGGSGGGSGGGGGGRPFPILEEEGP